MLSMEGKSSSSSLLSIFYQLSSSESQTVFVGETRLLVMDWTLLSQDTGLSALLSLTEYETACSGICKGKHSTMVGRISLQFVQKKKKKKDKSTTYINAFFIFYFFTTFNLYFSTKLKLL